MSIYTTNNPNILRLSTHQSGVRDLTQTPQRPSTEIVHASSMATSPTAANAETAPLAPSFPIERPPGTDPTLWSILSAEEREFFSRAGAMGPLTYGRAFTDMKSAQLPAPLGGRLDVKI